MKHLTKDELKGLLAVAEKHDPSIALLLLVIFNHGLRVSEGLALTAANVIDGYLVVQRLKGSKKTIQPLLADEREGLENLSQANGGQFWTLSRFAVNRRIAAYGREAGIAEHKLHSHILKHTTGRLAYEGGLGIPELQKYLGHVNGKNTLVYAEAPEDAAAKAFAAAVGK